MIPNLIFGFVFLPTILSKQLPNTKLPFQPGLICNLNVFPGVAGQEFQHHFCVPSSRCSERPARFPIYSVDRCPLHLQTETASNPYKCCHANDILDSTPEDTTPTGYIPGLKSYLICLHNAHYSCYKPSRKAKSIHYCEDYQSIPFVTKPRWNPTTIEAYPYTAQIGYLTPKRDVFMSFCLGTIITDRHVLTAASCASINLTLPDSFKTFVGFNGINTSPSHVYVGEDKHCHFCTHSKEEYRTEIKTFTIHPDFDPAFYYFDIGVIEVDVPFYFNRYARPACLLTEFQYLKDSASFGGYGEPEILKSTGEYNKPIFKRAPVDNTIKFKLSTEEALVVLNNIGRPYRKDAATLIYLRSELGRSTIQFGWDEKALKSRDIWTETNTEAAVGSDRFYELWIVFNDSYIGIGRGWNKVGVNPFLENSYVANKQDYRVTAYGIYSEVPASWIFPAGDSSRRFHGGTLETHYFHCVENLIVDGNDPKLGSSTFEELLFCAMDPNLEFMPCNGDWGGGLVTGSPFCTWQLIGVFPKPLSQNCSKHTGVFFTNVSYFLPWIEDTIWTYDFALNDLNLGKPLCSIKPDSPFETGRC